MVSIENTVAHLQKDRRTLVSIENTDAHLQKDRRRKSFSIKMPDIQAPQGDVQYERG